MSVEKNKWEVVGTTVYQLNDYGFNRWSFDVQGGHIGRYERTGLDERIRIARLAGSAQLLLEALQAYLAWSDPVLCRDTELQKLRDQMRAAVSAATKE